MQRPHNTPRVQSAARREPCPSPPEPVPGRVREGWFVEVFGEPLGIMSDLSVTLEALARGQSQLSVSSYFDADLFQREK